MYELRFALIGLSVILLAGLTWWEMRRGRATRDYRDSRPADRQEPRMDALEGEGVSGDLPFIDDEEPIIATRQAPELRDDPGAPPPVVTSPRSTICGIPPTRAKSACSPTCRTASACS